MTSFPKSKIRKLGILTFVAGNHAMVCDRERECLHRRNVCNRGMKPEVLIERSSDAVLAITRQTHTCCAKLPLDPGGEERHLSLDKEKQLRQEWRPHHVTDGDVNEDIPNQIPVELAEGFVDSDVTRPRFDLDTDETLLMWKLRRSLHEDDYKRIFEDPHVGGM